MARALLIALLALLVPSAASAAVHLDSVGTFTQPVHVTSFPGDPDRLLVVERAGTIQLSDHGVASTFLDLRSLVTDADPSAEQGLLSVAIAPDYPTSHHIYVFYTSATSQPSGALTVDEFTAAGDSAPLSSRRNLLSIRHPLGEENGGQLQFGPDGMLYVGTGDNATPGAAQGLGSFLGKILRIDTRPSPGGAPYTVPAENPFPGSPIWAYGLRNPWRFSFDRMTGDLLIGDVGESTQEEIDFAPAPAAGRGMNFGWDCREGTIAGPGGCSGTFVDPIFSYPHEPHETHCAITGGYVVRDASLGGLYGRYLYADACGDVIRSLVPSAAASTDRSEGLRADLPSSFGEDSCGRLYVTALHSGDVSRFDGDAPAQCTVSQPPPPPAPTCAGRPATRVAGSGAAITGTAGDDVIVGDSRGNHIRSGAGDDLICAGDGGDRIAAGAGRDHIKGGPGKDRIKGGPGKDKCRGGPGKDRTKSC